jgi:autotransporter-associated beta strand protein
MKPTGITPSLAAAIVFGLAQTVNAADGTYTSQVGAWNLEGSWSDGIIADGTDSTAFFTNDVTAARTTSLGEDRTIGHIEFTDADNATGFNRTIANNILTFDVTSGRATIDVTQDNRQLIFGSQLSGNDGLKLTGLGLVRFNNLNNDYSGGTEINAGSLWLAASGAAGSGTIHLGNTTGSDNAELRMSATGTTISNALEVRAGSSGVKILANRSTNTVTYSGAITANDDLVILLAGATGGSVFTISGASNSIAASKKVSFDISGGGTGRIADNALWSGDGSISYTSNADKGFTILGAKTYSGGATLGSMSGTGIVIVQTSSTGPANAPTDGPFGTGTLTIGATKMRAVDSAVIAIGNALTFTDNPTFTTIADEKSLIFSGNVSLGADRTLTVDTGSTVNTAFVEFSGDISGSGFGITKAGPGSLVLSGTNTYTGDTTVNAGVLALTGTSIANTGKLVIHGGTVDLTHTETVATLFFGATQQPDGNYSASSVPPGATITTASFSGSGTLTVGASTGGDSFADWISDPAFGIAPGDQGLNADPDGDGIANGVENFFGTNPGEFSQGLLAGTMSGNSFTFTHPRNATPASDLTAGYRWSTNLTDWYVGDNVDGPGGGLTVGIVADPVGPPITTVTATASQPVPKLFLRVEVTSN